MKTLLREIAQCRQCTEHLPLGPRPVLLVNPAARILIIGQAPGTKVHQTGIPWNDPSGDELRRWLNIDRDTFYNNPKIAIMPMGFCYPGKGTSGDLPPRPECAPLWHLKVRQHLNKTELTLLIGKYAQDYYLGIHAKKTLSETVKNYAEYLPGFIPLVHPSPRNRLWQKNNPWFMNEIVPVLRKKVSLLLA